MVYELHRTAVFRHDEIPLILELIKLYFLVHTFQLIFFPSTFEFEDRGAEKHNIDRHSRTLFEDSKKC